MAWSAKDLERAREAISALLDDLGVEAYVFAVEPREDGWEVKLECAVTQGWESLTLPVDIRLLLASPLDQEARTRLAQDWNARLAACRRAGSP